MNNRDDNATAVANRLSPPNWEERVRHYMVKLADPTSLSLEERLSVDRGVLAFRCGFPRDANPFAVHCAQHEVWDSAFGHAQAEAIRRARADRQRSRPQ